MDAYSPFGGLAAGLGIFLVIIYLVIFGFSIYCIVLYIKLANRGIKALDIYLSRNGRPNYPNPQNYGGGSYYARPNNTPPVPPPNRDGDNKREG